MLNCFRVAQPLHEKIKICMKFFFCVILSCPHFFTCRLFRLYVLDRKKGHTKKLTTQTFRLRNYYMKIKFPVCFPILRVQIGFTDREGCLFLLDVIGQILVGHSEERGG